MLMTLGVFGSNLNIQISADDEYALACSNFEVSKITDDGKFEKYNCYSDFETANAKMKELGKDYVVRHNTSKSATRIVSMVEGVAYAVGRDDSSTINLYNGIRPTSDYKSTYIATGYELNYDYTVVYYPSGEYESDGYAKISMNGFDGYVDLINIDLVPSKFLEKGLPIKLGGNDYRGTSSKAQEVIMTQNYYEAKVNGNYTDLVYYAHMNYPNKNDLYATTYTYRIGPAPSEMQTGVRYYSRNGYEFYTDPQFKNFAFEYYPYYQYLPLRSKSNITADDLNKALLSVKGSNTNSVLKGNGAAFIEAQETYGVNALLLYAMACQESAWGTSGYALNRNNLFGWNAFDSDPDRASYFDSVKDCVIQMAGANLRGYLDITDARYFSSSLGNKGSGFNLMYASDPYWGMSIASIAYQIDKMTNNSDGTLSDYDTYNVAVIDKLNTPIKASADDKSTTYYNATYGRNYLEAFTIIVLGQEGDYTKIQFTNPVNSKGMVTGNLENLVTYDFDKSVAYVKTKDIHMIYGENVSDGNKPSEPSGPSGDDVLVRDVMSVSNFKLNENGTFLIEGKAFTTGMNYTDPDVISHKLLIIDAESESVVKEVVLETVETNGLTLNDGYDYKYSAFKGTIDINDLEAGSYLMKILVTNGNYSKEITVRCSNIDYSQQFANLDDKVIGVSTNIIYNTRFEIDILKVDFDFNLISKPTVQKSILTSFDMGFDENGLFTLDGYGYIQYADFGKDDKTNFEFYFVNVDTGEKYALDTKKTACIYDLSETLNKDNDLSDACYNATIDANNLPMGEYELYAVIQNDTYYDIFYFTDRREFVDDDYASSSKTYDLFVSKDRFKIKLNVEDLVNE